MPVRLHGHQVEPERAHRATGADRARWSGRDCDRHLRRERNEHEYRNGRCFHRQCQLRAVGQPNAYYLTLTPRNGPYDATGWVSTFGGNGATPELVSDVRAGGALQYSATGGWAIDEHVVFDENSTPGPVTFDLQMQP